MADNWTIPKNITLVQCTNYRKTDSRDASGKNWPAVIWQTWSGKDTQSVFPKSRGGPWNTTYRCLKTIQTTCNPYSVNGISYSTINSGDLVADSPINSIINSVNNELKRRGINDPKYVGNVAAGQTAFAVALVNIGAAIHQISSDAALISNNMASLNIPISGDIISTTQPTSMTNALSVLIRECVCYTDCALYSVCNCYGYCNHY